MMATSSAIIAKYQSGASLKRYHIVGTLALVICVQARSGNRRDTTIIRRRRLDLFGTGAAMNDEELQTPLNRLT